MNLGSIKDKSVKRKQLNRVLTASAFLCAAVVAVTAAISLSGRENTNQLVLEAPGATARPTEQSKSVQTPAPTNDSTSSSSGVEITQDRESSGSASVVGTSMALPLAGGNVLKGYASDRLVYSSTLKHWATHTGLDFAASEGTPVLAALDGQIAAIEEDPLMGMTVTLEHENGLQTFYASLQKVKDGLNVGDRILRGQELGSVGASAACESQDGAHLHFEVRSNEGKAINPQTYLTGLIK